MKLLYAFLVVVALFMLNVRVSPTRSAENDFAIPAFNPTVSKPVRQDSLDDAFEKAVWTGNAQLVLQLLEMGADVNHMNTSDGYSALHWAVERDMEDVTKILLEHGADVDALTQNAIGKDRSALHIAAELGHTKLVNLLLDYNADVHIRTAFGETPLHGVRLFVKEPQIVEALLDHGANINAVTTFGSTPLHAATLQGSADITRLLIRQGANLNQANKRGLTPLHHAAEQGYTEVIQALIQAKAELDAQTLTGDTALHLAARKGHGNIIRILLSEGANPLSLNRLSKSPLTEARERANDAVVALLTEVMPLTIEGS